MFRFLVRVFPILLLFAPASLSADHAGATLPSCPHTATITGRVVLDKNRDGVADEREPGIGGWKLEADLADNPQCAPVDLPKAMTDADGRFRFSNLVPGAYYLNYAPPDNFGLKRWTACSPDIGSGSDGERVWVQRIRVEVADGGVAETSIEVIPLEGTASFSGLLYFDSNKSGVHDPGEPLVASIPLMGLGWRTPKGYASVRSGSSWFSPSVMGGRYEFSELAPGDYVAGVIPPPSKPVNPPADANGIANGPVTLSQGEQRSGVDFGFEVPAPVPTRTPASTPAPRSSSPAAMGTIGAPNTGSGSRPREAGRGDSWAVLLVAGALAACGAMAVASRLVAVRRQQRQSPTTNPPNHR
ncbi:MAG: SdrD B-like domain-containing protein [Dehalococcoidia bacterium]|jgi:hypothetical protein